LDVVSEDGRGLGMVAIIAHRWGELGDKHSRAMWFELQWDAANIPAPTLDPSASAGYHEVIETKMDATDYPPFVVLDAAD
jgi:hypothetical protein